VAVAESSEKDAADLVETEEGMLDNAEGEELEEVVDKSWQEDGSWAETVDPIALSALIGVDEPFSGMASTFFSATSDEAEGMLTSDDDSVLVVLEFVGAKSFLLESKRKLIIVLKSLSFKADSTFCPIPLVAYEWV